MPLPLTQRQAEAIADIMPRLMRMLSTLEDDPADELSLAQLRVCVLLRDGPRPMSRLSDEFSVSLSAMTRIADRLERAGLVERIPEANDRRVRCLQLTERGTAIMRRRDRARARQVAAVLEQLPARRRKEVLESLEVLMEACNAMRLQEAVG